MTAVKNKEWQMKKKNIYRQSERQTDGRTNTVTDRNKLKNIK